MSKLHVMQIIQVQQVSPTRKKNGAPAEADMEHLPETRTYVNLFI